jgi:hypothetical protein
MILNQEPAKLEVRGNMAHEMDENGLGNNRMDKEQQNACCFHSGTGFFEIHIKGHLDGSWSDWLEGLEVMLLDNGEMILCGYIRDQAALMSILNRLYGLNLTLLSVREINPKNEARKKINQEI